jgi:hypothetical protein
MLRAGMRVQVKATHLPGYEDWRWLRVLQTSITPVASGTRYQIGLELQGPGADAGGGPYAGSAFAGLLRVDGSFGAGPYFSNTGDVPPGGWYEEPLVGPMTIDQSVAPFSSITVGEAMVVRIQLKVSFVYVASDGDTLTIHVLVNGASIATDSGTKSGGGGYWDPTLEVDARNVSLAAGDVVSWSYDAPVAYAILNNGIGTEQTFLRVGRGTQTWDFGSQTWVGP